MYVITVLVCSFLFRLGKKFTVYQYWIRLFHTTYNVEHCIQIHHNRQQLLNLLWNLRLKYVVRHCLQNIDRLLKIDDITRAFDLHYNIIILYCNLKAVATVIFFHAPFIVCIITLMVCIVCWKICLLSP